MVFSILMLICYIVAIAKNPGKIEQDTSNFSIMDLLQKVILQTQFLF